MTNKLQSETSPYLLQHADNPVDWYPWGEEALEKAGAEDKPVFLSIGYASCHWCHVMAHESFEDSDIADIMNEHFINVKVDREERPDVDALYMDAVVAMTGQGGWPMSVFLTPGGEPFFGGTYFPPQPRHGLPSFRQLLLGVARAWREDRQRLLNAGKSLTERLASVPSLEGDAEQLDSTILTQATEKLHAGYDWTHGGWGRAPKFPQSQAIEFLLRRFHSAKDKLARDMALHALRAMARGGIYDHLGGGFARYAVDRQWRVPHFEKMLYDNVLLVPTYVHAWQVSADPALLKTARGCLDFVLSELLQPGGGLASSLDADSEGEEGKYYVWDLEEVRGIIQDPQTADLFCAAYGVTQDGDFDGGNVLHQAIPEDELAQKFHMDADQVRSQLSQAREQLRAVRQHRVRPGLDDKVLTAWNGFALTALAEAARATGEESYLQAAQSLAAFLLAELVVDGRLKRSWRQGRARYAAYLEDHAALGNGLLALYQADYDPRWYAAAEEQAVEILEHFADPNGGFFDTRHDHEPLIARPKGLQDSPTPSGNALSAAFLLKLATLTGLADYLDPAETAISAMQATMAQHPTAFAGWLCALDFALSPRLQLALIGDPGESGFKALRQVVDRRYLPNMVLAAGEPDWPEGPQLLEDKGTSDGHATAYLCQSFACRLPTTDPDELQMQVEQALS